MLCSLNSPWNNYRSEAFVAFSLGFFWFFVVINEVDDSVVTCSRAMTFGNYIKVHGMVTDDELLD